MSRVSNATGLGVRRAQWRCRRVKTSSIRGLTAWIGFVWVVRTSGPYSAMVDDPDRNLVLPTSSNARGDPQLKCAARSPVTQRQCGRPLRGLAPGLSRLAVRLAVRRDHA